MRFRILGVAALCMIAALPVFAQNPTGSISGKVTYDGDPLPGVTVTVSSPALQGTKTAITSAAGDYKFAFLPPGQYDVQFEMASFQTLRQSLKVSAAQATTLDAEMIAAAVSEEIIVTSTYETISSGSQSSTTYEQSLVEDLPVDRDLNSAVLLTPGTNNAGPRGGITVAGSQSYENLFLINGVVVNENIRGQAFNLFIEDAIAETTTAVSGVSAEYGRFTGGVVNMITKSGGNEFSGSLRINLDNDDWTASTPLTTDKIDQVNEVYEGTLGGYILKDKLWFFLAARDFEDFGSEQFYGSNESFESGRDQQRYEGKLTFTPHVSHRVLVSYMEIDTEDTNNIFYPPTDIGAVDPARTLPQDLLALNYTGVLTDNFFVEAQYSERNMAFEESGLSGLQGDRINGTPIYHYYQGALGNAYPFCGDCGAEERNNENYLAKASWFLSTDTMGTHDLMFGYDQFNDIRIANNFQSPSNFFIWNYEPPQFDDAGNYYPVFVGGEDLDFWPIFAASRGTDFTTKSAYVNDVWRLNEKWLFNLGVRYDQNDGQNASGATIADDSQISPRLGVTYDIFGDGDWLVTANYGRYVAGLNNGVADSSAAGGQPAYFGYSYGGPPINYDPNSGEYLTEYTAPEALQIVFDWFDSVGGLANFDLWYASPSIPGLNTVINNLDSPYADEYTLGVAKRLGNRGIIRADYVHREYGDFYMSMTTLDTGTATFVGEEGDLAPGSPPFEVTVDQSIIVNDDDILEREYDGLHTQFQYRISDRLSVAGNWTWSHARGNFVGETSGSGAVTGGALSYPEYQQEEWAYPRGDLPTDQRHKVRAWAVWEALSTPRHNLAVSVLQNFWSGTPYGASGRKLVRPELYGADPFVDNPGYLGAPVFQTYWFTNRDAFTTDDIYRTDLSLNYSFFLGLGGTDLELFVQPEILNVFNADGAVAVDQTVSVDHFGWNPFTDQPVEGVDYTLGDDFGQPTEEDDYQMPRTFRVSVGLRF